jgi:hypothetical protein
MAENRSPIEINFNTFKKQDDDVVKKKVRVRDSVVKINSELLGKVEEFINLKENKFRYVNRKQFIDIAVFEALKRGKL